MSCRQRYQERVPFYWVRNRPWQSIGRCFDSKGLFCNLYHSIQSVHLSTILLLSPDTNLFRRTHSAQLNANSIEKGTSGRKVPEDLDTDIFIIVKLSTQYEDHVITRER